MKKSKEDSKKDAKRLKVGIDQVPLDYFIVLLCVNLLFQLTMRLKSYARTNFDYYFKLNVSLYISHLTIIIWNSKKKGKDNLIERSSYMYVLMINFRINN
jgi:hypothetical protein